jgi:hypothetical protein
MIEMLVAGTTHHSAQDLLSRQCLARQLLLQPLKQTLEYREPSVSNAGGVVGRGSDG